MHLTALQWIRINNLVGFHALLQLSLFPQIFVDEFVVVIEIYIYVEKVQGV